MIIRDLGLVVKTEHVDELFVPPLAIAYTLNPLEACFSPYVDLTSFCIDDPLTYLCNGIRSPSEL